MAPSRTGGKRGATAAVAGVLALVALVSACGSDDESSSSGESGAVVGDTASAEPDTDATAPATGDDATDDEVGSDDGVVAPDLEPGLGSATLSYGDEVHRFALTSENSLQGQCETLFGVLIVDLPLVESNGVEVPSGSGRLQIDVELEDVADFEPYAELMVPGGHWVAGDSETASLTGVETPEITLVASGTTITGTQTMVPLVAGPGEPIEATVEVACG